MRKPRPDPRVNLLAFEFPFAGSNGPFEESMQTTAPFGGAFFVVVKADDREPLRQQILLREIVERRDDQALREVAIRSKNDERAARSTSTDILALILAHCGPAALPSAVPLTIGVSKCPPNWLRIAESKRLAKSC